MVKKNKDVQVGYGYVGRWNDGSIGWFLPNHCSGGRRNCDGISQFALENGIAKGETFALCRITVEVVHDKRGREIRRVVR